MQANILLRELESRGIGPFRSIGGGEFVSPVCPFCGHGDDDLSRGQRFHLSPALAEGKGAYRCFACGAGGNGVDLLMHRFGLTFPQARDLLGLASGTRKAMSRSCPACPPGKNPSFLTSQDEPRDEAEIMPSAQWREHAERLLSYMDANLPLDYYDMRQGALGYDRGLDSVQNWTAYRIVYSPRTFYQAPELWGLEGKKIPIPKGIVIALQRRAGIVGVICKPMSEAREKFGRFRIVRGSAAIPYVLGRPGKPLVIVESALDAALLYQESGGTLATIATNSASWRLTRQALDFARQAPEVWYWQDNDDAGDRAYEAVKRQLPHAVQLKNPSGCGKDPCELHVCHRDDPGVPSVADWLEACGVLDVGNKAA